MKLLSLFLLLCLGLGSQSLSYADGSGAGFVGEIILMVLYIFIGVIIIGIIIVLLIFKLVAKILEKDTPQLPISNAPQPTIREMIQKQRTLKMKIVCSCFSILYYASILGVCYLEFKFLNICYSLIYFFNDFNYFLTPTIYIFSLLISTFFILLLRHSYKKIIHYIDFLEFKKMQKNNGVFIMPPKNKE